MFSQCLYDQESAMKLPRFRIGFLMVVVAIAALNFTVLRAVLATQTEVGELLAAGAMPMASVLAVSLLVGYRRPDSHPSLPGFTLFGAIALGLYVFLAIRFPD